MRHGCFGPTAIVTEAYGPRSCRKPYCCKRPIPNRQLRFCGKNYDGQAPYCAFARDTGIAHAFVNLNKGERVRGAIHVQDVSNNHRRFRAWLAHSHGVASRHLPNYLGWRSALDGERTATTEHCLRAALGRFNTNR